MASVRGWYHIRLSMNRFVTLINFHNFQKRSLFTRVVPHNPYIQNRL